jgi:ATP-binding cassette, subfamily C, bacterial
VVSLNSKNPFLSYAGTLVREMPSQVALAMGLMIFMAVSEGASLLLLIPLLQLVGLDVQQGNMGQIAEAIAYAFSAFHVKPTLEAVLLLYIGAVSLQSWLNRLQSNISSYLQYNFIVHLRERFYRALANADYLYLSKSRSSDLAQLLMQETDRIGYGTFQALYLVVNIIVAIVYLFLAFRISPQVMILVLISGGGLALILKGQTEKSRDTGRKIYQSNKGLYAAAMEHMQAMKTTKSYGAEERNTDIFSGLAEDIGQGNLEVSRQYALVTNLYEVGSVIALSFIMYVSMKVLNMPLTSLMVVLLLFARLMPKFSSIQSSYQRFITLLPAFTALDETVREMESKAEVKADHEEDIGLNKSLDLQEVVFSYDESHSPVLSGISLRVPVGMTVGLVGPSGSGKSTIADLLIGLIKPVGGRILVDGEALSQEKIRAWRRLIGYVSQDTFLFNDTVRANLLWACPDATEEEMTEALRLAAADKFVARLTQGIDTILGDRGVRLSGGERQRLALARAILRKPSLLILDEATSNLDSESEKRIQAAVEGLHGTLTSFVVTHRLSTLQNADVIYVLEMGKIVESGSRDELLALKGRFFELCVTQGMEDSSESNCGSKPLPRESADSIPKESKPKFEPKPNDTLTKASMSGPGGLRSISCQIGKIKEKDMA